MNRNGYNIPTGDFVGQMWDGPHWTPYAQAIADHYPTQVPWFLTTRVDLAAAVTLQPARVTLVTSPYLYDVLIFGAMVTGTDSQIPFIGVQVTHQESGVPWAIPNVLPFIPLTAFGGLNANTTSIFRWPEAFFLPKHTRLKLDFNLIDTSIGNPDPITVTLAGVQLINAKTPKTIKMPDGQDIRVDSRLPLFMTMGLGVRTPGTSAEFECVVGTQYVQYLPPIECDVEIHDVSTTLLNSSTGINIPVNLLTKLTIMGVERQWTPNLSPITAVAGGAGGGAGAVTQVFPALPFTKPYLLPKGCRIQIAIQNNNAASTFENRYITFRGVRRCEYS